MSAMFGTTRQTNRSHHAILAVVLFAVLLASTALAWWLARIRRPSTEQGAEILAGIRSRKLSAFWTGTSEQWFLARKGNIAVSWRLAWREPSEDGHYSGLDVFPVPGSPQAYWEHWTLNADATEGHYTAGTVTRGPIGFVVQADTQIDLRKGRITAVQQIEGKQYRSSTSAPPEYLPEGTLLLAASRVAAQKGRGGFVMVSNQTPPEGDRTRLLPIVMSYAGAAEEELFPDGAMVNVGGGDWVVFDSRGNLIGRIWKADNIVELTASAGDVAYHFREAPQAVQAITTYLKRSTATKPVDDSKPGE